jgi:hypothetical protein
MQLLLELPHTDLVEWSSIQGPDRYDHVRKWQRIHELRERSAIPVAGSFSNQDRREGDTAERDGPT